MGRLIARVGVASLVCLLTGCGVANQPPYTEQELKKKCEDRGGRWHDDDLRGGFCEYNTMA
ncbi:MAG TPA: hypothetical protein VEL75_17250 [Candidatus Methylomirabilis sp.]|nr:hypothetical protein [Candidatus Methylomirabilis sp.]